MTTNFNYILILLLIGLVGCQTTEPQDANGHELHKNQTEIHPEETPTISVTQWSSTLELFMNYNTPLTGHNTQFTIHLTTLTNFQPVQNGNVTLLFKTSNGNTLSVKSDKMSQSGIFTPNIVFDTVGEYRFFVKYDGLNSNELFDAGDEVWEDIDDVSEQIWIALKIAVKNAVLKLEQ